MGGEVNIQFSNYVTLTGSVQWMCKEILSRDTKIIINRKPKNGNG